MDDQFDDNPEWTDENSRPADIVEKLQAARAALLMKQADFAILLGVPLSTLRNWEQRRTVPEASARTLIELLFEDPRGMAERLARRNAA